MHSRHLREVKVRWGDGGDLHSKGSQLGSLMGSQMGAGILTSISALSIASIAISEHSMQRRNPTIESPRVESILQIPSSVFLGFIVGGGVWKGAVVPEQKFEKRWIILGFEDILVDYSCSSWGTPGS